MIIFQQRHDPTHGKITTVRPGKPKTKKDQATVIAAKEIGVRSADDVKVPAKSPAEPPIQPKKLRVN